MTKKELWLRIKNYHFEPIVPPNFLENITTLFGGADASTKAFADKIARKHQWKKSFALKAIQEYKKFVYLGIVSNFYVTPSKNIDIVWHEHLLFSKAYRDFCTTIIEYDFDHYPELIPFAEQTGTFNAQYLETLELYYFEFGVEAPSDIWEASKFNKYEVVEGNFTVVEKKKSATSLSKHTTYYDQNPLNSYFEISQNNTVVESYPEFGGGDFGGAGASGDWGSNGDASDGGNGGGCSGGCGGGD